MPSEYFYRALGDRYCLAIDPLSRDNEMMFGGSLLRQYMFVFDVENKKLGYVRAKCSDDPNMIMNDDEIYAVNNADKHNDECYDCIVNRFTDYLFLNIIIFCVVICKSTS